MLFAALKLFLGLAGAVTLEVSMPLRPPGVSAPPQAGSLEALKPLAPLPALSIMAAPSVELPKEKLIDSLAMEMVQAESAQAAEADFLARAQLGPKRVLPPLVAAELDVIAPRLQGSALGALKRREVLDQTEILPVRWYHHFTYPEQPLPQGVTFPDNRIQLLVRRGWKKYPSYENHFRILFAHEYAHRLQNEEVLSRRYGLEIAPVGVELLRGIELAGFDGLRAGAVSFIGEGLLGSFENGRKWARSDRAQEDGFVFKGFLAGAAYELYIMTGRWSDAWDFLKLVCAAQGALSPAQAARRVLAGHDGSG